MALAAPAAVAEPFAVQVAFATAFARLARDLAPPPAERCTPVQAAGRILAQAPRARLDLPGVDLAAMDGYALCAADAASERNELHVAGRVLAGHAASAPVAAGQCVRIMTGAPMPAGTDAVVVSEVARELDGGRVLLPGPVLVGANRRQRGEHVRAGDAVFVPGRLLRTADVALLAALGEAEVAVYRALRVGVLSTGDELRDAPAPLPLGGAYDSNRPMLLAALAGGGLQGTDLGICPDDGAALEGHVQAALDARLDALLVSGGAATGDADIVRALGGIEFVEVAVRPGRGMAVARIAHGGGTLLLLGLPGNAVAAYALMHLLAMPLLRRLGGASAGPPEPLPVALADAATGREGRIDLRRARLRRDASGAVAAHLLPAQGSAMLRSVCDADLLVAIGPQSHYDRGAFVAGYLLSDAGVLAGPAQGT